MSIFDMADLYDLHGDSIVLMQTGDRYYRVSLHAPLSRLISVTTMTHKTSF